MFTKAFAKDALERAVKAFAGVGAALFVVGQTSVLDFDWAGFFGTSGGAAVASVLLSLASYKAGNTGTASVVKAVDYVGDRDAL